jgi:hypothetical protein
VVVAVEAGVRPGDRELGHALRVMDRHVEGDDAAVAVADDNRALDPQLAHQLDRVLGHLVVVERTIDEVGSAPMPHLLRRDHPELGREERDPLPGDRAAATVEQQQRRAVPVNLVVHVEPVDGDVGHWPASIALGWFGPTPFSRRQKRQAGQPSLNSETLDQLLPAYVGVA